MAESGRVPRANAGERVAQRESQRAAEAINEKATVGALSDAEIKNLRDELAQARNLLAELRDRATIGAELESQEEDDAGRDESGIDRQA